MSTLRLWSGVFAVWAAVTLLPRMALAFTIETIVTRGCHEEITGDVLRATRAALPKIAVPLASTGDDRALIDDVMFTVPGDLNDIGAVTLLLGVRDNDVKSFAATAVAQLSALNADPATQKEHCLRTAEENEPTGSSAAVDDCRAYIRATLLSALDGLDAQGRPDGSKRESLDVTLAIRGGIHVDVPIFYLRAGRALHAIEDSFTHSFRNVADRHKVTVVLNWIEYADNNLHENVDGPPHLSELDRCDDPDALRTERRHLAIEAGTAALSGLLDEAADPAAKALGVDALLDKYISFDTTANCTNDNRWCNAPELAYMPSGCGCTLGGSNAPTSSVAAILVAFVTLIGRARGRRKRAVAGVLSSVALTIAPRIARADEPGPTKSHESGPLSALAGESNAGASGKHDKPGAFFGRLALGASYDKPGFAGGLGLRYQMSKPFMIGFDAELNPWIASPPTRVRAGALNTYMSLIRRFQLKSDSLNVRTTVGLGTSVLLIDLVGAPAGSVGPFLGLSFLGIEWKVSPGFYLTVDPSYIAFPVPHLTGAPFGYLQYRFQVGLEFGGG